MKSANCVGNPLYQATEQHLHNSVLVKNDEKWDEHNSLLVKNDEKWDEKLIHLSVFGWAIFLSSLIKGKI